MSSAGRGWHGWGGGGTGSTRRSAGPATPPACAHRPRPAHSRGAPAPWLHTGCRVHLVPSFFSAWARRAWASWFFFLECRPPRASPMSFSHTTATKSFWRKLCWTRVRAQPASQPSPAAPGPSRARGAPRRAGPGRHACRRSRYAKACLYLHPPCPAVVPAAALGLGPTSLNLYYKSPTRFIQLLTLLTSFTGDDILRELPDLPAAPAAPALPAASRAARRELRCPRQGRPAPPTTSARVAAPRAASGCCQPASSCHQPACLIGPRPAAAVRLPCSHLVQRDRRRHRRGGLPRGYPAVQRNLQAVSRRRRSPPPSPRVRVSGCRDPCGWPCAQR